MRFELDDQQRAFQQAVAAYLDTECPLERALAPHESGEADLGIWRGLMGLGVGAICVPEAYGGLGLGLLDLAVIAEPLGHFAAPGPFLEHALATLAIVLGGNEAQKERWLPDLASGEKRATIALSEAKGAWAADGWAMTAGRRIAGTKRHVLHAQDADLIVVGLERGGLGVVEGGADGLAISPTPSTDAGKQLARVEFADVPAELLPHPAGAQIVDAGLVLLAADAFGGASRCVDMAVAYSKEREQFGRSIGSFQAVKHQLADMALATLPAAGLYWYAAYAIDAEVNEAASFAALAKAHLTETYARIARRTIEAHGGIGYTWEFGAHVWLKRALFDQAYLGMPSIHRRRYAMMAGW